MSRTISRHTDKAVHPSNKRLGPEAHGEIAPDGASPEEVFLNRIPCEGFAYPFIDRYAQFGVGFDHGRAMGPGSMALRSTALTNQPSDALLQLWVRDEEGLTPVPRQNLSHLPWCAKESASLPGTGLQITAEHVFLNERVLATRFTFLNADTSPIELDCLFVGLAMGDRYCRSPHELGFYGLPKDLPLRKNHVACEDNLIRGGLTDGGEILPEPAFRIRTASQSLSAWCSAEPVWVTPERMTSVETRSDTGLHYAFEGRIHLPSGASIEHIFVSELTVATSLCMAPAIHDIDPASIDFEAEVERAREDFLIRVGWQNPPAVRTPIHFAKAWRARWALLRTGYKADGEGGEYGHNIASTCTADSGGFTRNFFWDALFSSAAAATFEPELAKGSIRSVFSRLDPHTGYCPEHSYNYHVPAHGVLSQMQAPVATWAMEKYLAANPDDEAFLVEMYPTLLAVHRHWIERADRDGDGLMEWQWAGQTADNSPLFDDFLTDGATNGWLGPQASVQLNAFLHRDAIALAAFADRLGKPQEAMWARSLAAERHERFMKLCYVPSEHRFWDYSHLRRTHIRAKTFYLFWPIWAGMDVPAETKRQLLDEVLLDPKQFFGPVPFPSVAYDDPAYNESSYWRGKAWPHISYWLIEMLRREGRHEAAEEARRRLLGSWLRGPGFSENKRTDAGKMEPGRGSQLDYNWGIAAVLLLLGESSINGAT